MMNHYEKGKHYPDYKTAERLAKVLNVSTLYLFVREHDLPEWILQFKQQTNS
ncbi:MAG: helix-turn-helix transcriptional regulator [Bdellovibrio sp.]|nr:helix-turn-helix transcriptional regulator [Methylotenera sp.]